MPRLARASALSLLLLAACAAPLMAQTMTADRPTGGSGLVSPIGTVTDEPSRAPQSWTRFYIDLLTQLALRFGAAR